MPDAPPSEPFPSEPFSPLRQASSAAPLRVGVLISGRGSNLQALIAACVDANYPATIARVISNVPDALGVRRAREAGLSVTVVDHRDFPDRASFDAALDADLRAHDVELICLAGFVRLLDDAFVLIWGPRMLNIHPSLLPAFPGLNVPRRLLAAGCQIAGCTVHFVTTEMDVGPIVAQAAVPVHPDDDEDSLAARVLTAEHRLYPHALRLVAEGRAKLAESGRLVHNASLDLFPKSELAPTLFGPFGPRN